MLEHGVTLAMRFVGHSTVRLEIAGTVLLTDPVLGARVGPLLRTGPAPSPGAWVDTDLVLLSHLHGDHLHLPSLRLLSAVGARVVAPRGAGDVTVYAAGDTDLFDGMAGLPHPDVALDRKSVV